MTKLDLENWLSRVKEFSINEVIQAQETILQELKQKTTALQTGYDKANGNGNSLTDLPQKVTTAQTVMGQVNGLIGNDLPPELAKEHFEWVEQGDIVIGKTAVGRATIEALQLNRIRLVTSRRGWVRVGWHPPSD